MPIQTWKKGLQETFKDSCARSVAPVAALGLFLLLVMIPVWSTPGNDVLFQLHLLKWHGVLLLALLSLANGILIAMQLAIHHKRQKNSAVRQVANATTLGGILAGSITTALACAACYSSILAILGFGATAFLVHYRILIGIMALLVTFAAIHYSARRLNNACAVCHI